MERKCQTGSTKLRRENCLLFYIPLKEQELGGNRPVAFPRENSRQTKSQFRYRSCRPPTPIIHQGSFSLIQSFAATNNGAVERMFRMGLLLVTVSRATLQWLQKSCLWLLFHSHLDNMALDKNLDTLLPKQSLGKKGDNLNIA